MNSLSDYQRFFVGGADLPDILLELHAREEARSCEPLKPCDCCGAGAGVQENAGVVQIACSQKRCRVVEGRTLAEAARLWNEPRFSQAK
jgi:hypothetical protein